MNTRLLQCMTAPNECYFWFLSMYPTFSLRGNRSSTLRRNAWVDFWCDSWRATGCLSLNINILWSLIPVHAATERTGDAANRCVGDQILTVLYCIGLMVMESVCCLSFRRNQNIIFNMQQFLPATFARLRS